MIGRTASSLDEMLCGRTSTLGQEACDTVSVICTGRPQNAPFQTFVLLNVDHASHNPCEIGWIVKGDPRVERAVCVPLPGNSHERSHDVDGSGTNVAIE